MTDETVLGREIQRVTSAVAHWSPARWRVAAESGGDRVAAMTALVQTIADLGARAEGRRVRPVPRLPHPTALVDQLRVVGADLLAARPDADTLAAARAAVERARTVLF